MGDGNLLKINELSSKSLLSNNALFSSECSRGKFLNLYKIMLHDIPGKNGRASSAEIYVNALRDNGLDVTSVHFHWWGSSLGDKDRGVTAIHHQKIGMHPIDFTQRTIDALKTAMQAIMIMEKSS